MSRLPKLSLLVSLLFLSSCSLFKELSSDDVTRITSEYFDENHDMVFYSTLSLLQAEQFTIVQADKESGIIRGTRHTERDDVERNLKPSAQLPKGNRPKPYSSFYRFPTNVRR